MRRGRFQLALVIAVTTLSSLGHGAATPGPAAAQLPALGDLGPDLPSVELPAAPLPPTPPPAGLAPVEAPPVGLSPVQDGTGGAPLPGALGGPAGSATPGVPEGGSGAGGFTAGGPASRDAGAPGRPGAERRAGRRQRTGLFSTRHRTRTALVRAFDGCLDEISRRGATLLVLRYGVGSFDPSPASEVARRLELTLAGYVRARDRALRSLVRRARLGSCESEGKSEGESGAGATSTWRGAMSRIATVSAPLEDGDSPGRNVREGERRAAVLGASASGGAETPGAPAPGVVAPASLGAEGGGLPLPAVLVAALLLGSLAWLFAVRPARAAAERRRAYRSYLSNTRKK